SFLLPSSGVAVLELAFIPVLGWSIAPVLFSRGNSQNLIFLAILALFFTADLLIHLEAPMGAGGMAATGLRFGVNLLMVLIVIVIGRIVPTFCRVARLGEGAGASPVSRPLLEAAAIGSVALLALVHLAFNEALWTGWLALVAAIIQMIRMLNWRAGRLLLKPYIFALHLGYAWVIAGLLLMGVAILGGPIPEISALHAVTVGGIGTMILAVMSIVGLLHTGRPAEMHPLIVLSYLLVSCAALLRVSAPILLPELYRESLIASGALWAAAFGIYAAVYWPILTKARPDGIPG
ncbi:MAG: NnrS family protein, partial [bacterium]|nr:NnrS family protein [bacterium]